MPTKSANEAQGTPFARRFQESVTLIEYDGRPVVVAREFGSFLGYGDEGRLLVTLITGDWVDEFIPDVDSILLKNGRLADFKQVCASLGLNLVDKRAPSLLLLTESGIQLVLARSEKPEGKVFRRWLVSEVIPEYGRIRAIPGPAAPQVEGSARPVPRLPRRPRHTGPATPADIAREVLYGLHTGGAVDRSAYDALRGLIDQLAAQAPPPDPAAAPDAPIGRGPRRLTGPVETLGETQVRQIREAMLATNPRGPLATGPVFDALVMTFSNAEHHERDLIADRMRRRDFLALKMRDAGEWAQWRVSTGLNMEIAEALVGAVVLIIEGHCGSVPGWS